MEDLFWPKHERERRGFMPWFLAGNPRVKEGLISTKKRNEKKLEMRFKLRSFT